MSPRTITTPWSYTSCRSTHYGIQIGTPSQDSDFVGSRVAATNPIIHSQGQHRNCFARCQYDFPVVHSKQLKRRDAPWRVGIWIESKALHILVYICGELVIFLFHPCPFPCSWFKRSTLFLLPHSFNHYFDQVHSLQLHGFGTESSESFPQEDLQKDVIGIRHLVMPPEGPHNIAKTFICLAKRLEMEGCQSQTLSFRENNGHWKNERIETIIHLEKKP